MRLNLVFRIGDPFTCVCPDLAYKWLGNSAMIDVDTDSAGSTRPTTGSICLG